MTTQNELKGETGAFMSVEKAMDCAYEWTLGQTFYAGMEGWRIVCATLANEIKRLQNIERENQQLQEKVERMELEVEALLEERQAEVKGILALRDELDARDTETFPNFVRRLHSEREQLVNLIDCACNALTDSINASGNDADTNMHWVKKLRKEAEAISKVTP